MATTSRPGPYERRRLKVQELEAQLEALSGVSFPPAASPSATSPGGTP